MKIKKNTVAFAVISVLGTLGHFVYEWTNESYIIGLFFPVNESTWEHLKLIFFPILIYFAAYKLLGKSRESVIYQAGTAAFWGMLCITVVFYTLSGIIGGSLGFLNIVIYYISVAFSLHKSEKAADSPLSCSGNVRLLFAVLIIICAMLFIVWSYSPPRLGIFIPPTE